MIYIIKTLTILTILTILIFYFSYCTHHNSGYTQRITKTLTFPIVKKVKVDNAFYYMVRRPPYFESYPIIKL